MANTINGGIARSIAYYPSNGTDIDDAGSNLQWNPATNMVTLVGRLQINQSSGATNTGLSVIHYGNSFTPVYISRSQGTQSSPSKVSSGNILGGISFTGRADTNFFTGAYINAVVDGAVSDTSMPSKIVFGTHNGSTLEVRAELSKLGELKVNTIKNFSGGDLTLSPAGKVVIDVNKLNITGGSPGQVLSVNSGGALAWTTPTSTGTVSDSTIRNAINAGTGIAFNKATGFITNTISSTDLLAEGTNNLYFTQARARNSISVGAGLTYNSVTGEITNTFTQEPVVYSGIVPKYQGVNAPYSVSIPSSATVVSEGTVFGGGTLSGIAIGTASISRHSSIAIGSLAKAGIVGVDMTGRAVSSSSIAIGNNSSAEVGDSWWPGLNGGSGIAIGTQSKVVNPFSISIGFQAGQYRALYGNTSQTPGSIILNASGKGLLEEQGKFKVDPVRQQATPISLYYNNETKEITYGDSVQGGGPSTLDTITDVNLTNISINDLLKYDGTNWINSRPTTAFNTVAVNNQANILANSNESTLTFNAGNGIILSTNTSTDTFTIASNIASFSTISVIGQSNIIADNHASTLTLNAGSGIAITTNPNNDTITISNTNIPGPVFMAYNSVAQSISSGTSTMNLIYSTATANTSNYYNTATGIFTPLVAGFYQVNASIYPTGGTYGSFFLGMYKNGSPIAMGNSVAVQSGWGQPGASSATVLVYLNGTTDNINCKLTTTSATGSWTTIVSPAIFFQAVWQRGA